MTALAKGFSLALLAGLALATPARSASPLELEAKIPIGNVAGRIDHFGYDAMHQQLFVAELGNNSVGVVDLTAGKVAHRLSGLSEPQGLGWHAATRTLYVANAGDGSVRLYQGPDFKPAGAIALGDDADNVRLDPWRDRVVVGYGGGGLAIVDPASRRKIADVRLKRHPESFQFDEQGQRIFANVPNAGEIAVVDVGQGKQTSRLELGGAHANFPMTVDAQGHRLLVATRSPARLLAFSTQDGKPLARVDTCDDADDVFVDAKRQRVYVTCGEGVVEVFAQHGDIYQSIGRVPTVSGARTSWFAPETDRLYVGVRARGGEPAAVWIFRPSS